MAILDITHTIFGVYQSDKACYFMPQISTEHCTNITILALCTDSLQHMAKENKLGHKAISLHGWGFLYSPASHQSGSTVLRPQVAERTAPLYPHFPAACGTAVLRLPTR